MTYERALITGLGRSGTTWISQVVKQFGLGCNHEVVYHPNKRPFTWRDELVESSYVGAPCVMDEPDTTLIIHLVRDPKMCLGSWAGYGYFNPGHKNCRLENAYLAWVNENSPEIFERKTHHERLCQFWVSWTRHVMKAAGSERYRVWNSESVSVEDIRQLYEDLGVEWPNHGKFGAPPQRSKPLPFDAMKVEDKELLEEAKALERHFGYE